MNQANPSTSSNPLSKWKTGQKRTHVEFQKTTSPPRGEKNEMPAASKKKLSDETNQPQPQEQKAKIKPIAEHPTKSIPSLPNEVQAENIRRSLSSIGVIKDNTATQPSTGPAIKETLTNQPSMSSSKGDKIASFDDFKRKYSKKDAIKSVPGHIKEHELDTGSIASNVQKLHDSEKFYALTQEVLAATIARCKENYKDENQPMYDLLNLFQKELLERYSKIRSEMYIHEKPNIDVLEAEALKGVKMLYDEQNYQINVLIQNMLGNDKQFIKDYVKDLAESKKQITNTIQLDRKAVGKLEATLNSLYKKNASELRESAKAVHQSFKDQVQVYKQFASLEYGMQNQEKKIHDEIFAEYLPLLNRDPHFFAKRLPFELCRHC